MFIAKISRGRTIKQFINGTMTAPVMYSFMWLVIFGGAGLRQERQAAGAGLCCADESGWFVNASSAARLLDERGAAQRDAVLAADAAYFLCDGGECGECARATLASKESVNATYGDFLMEYNK